MRKFLAKIYAFEFFDDFVLIYPLYVVMFGDFGMQPWQVAALLTAWSVTSFILEVPSGVWADKYSRKNILFLAQFIRAFGYIIWLIFPNFLGFLLGFICWGAKSALTSGTYQALLYDELKNFDTEKEFTKVLGRGKTIGYVAILLASVMASPAAFLGYKFVLGLSCISVFLAGIIIATLPNAQKIESTHEREYFSLLKEGLRVALKNPKIFQIILFLSFAFALGGALDEYWPIFAIESGLPKYGLGIFLAIMSGIQGIASLIAHRLEKRSNKFFYFLFLLNGIFFILAAYLFSIPALLLLYVFSALFTVIQIVFEGRLQHSIESATRATASSVSGFFVEIGVIAVYFSVGFLAQFYSYQYVFLAYGVLIAVVGFLYWLLGGE